ncbi:MAG: transposase, partial [Colwellia sp.]|nr:transposase [Colwellia sp.]
LELIELTGRCLREDKAGYIEENQPTLLTRLNISPENWLTLSKGFRKLFHGAVGHSDVLTEYCEHQGLKRRTNVTCCDKLLA